MLKLPYSSLVSLVHVSPDGKTIAALLNDIRLLVIKYVDRLAKGELTLDQCAVMVHFTYPVDPLFPAANGSSIYLAFEYGRVGVITVRLIMLFYVFSLTVSS